MSKDARFRKYYRELENIRIKYLVGDNAEYFEKKNNFEFYAKDKNSLSELFFKANNEYFDIQNKVLIDASGENRDKFLKSGFYEIWIALI